MSEIRIHNLELLHLLWLLPALVGFFLYVSERRRKTLTAFVEAGLLHRIAITVSPARRRWKAALLLLAAAFLVVGLSRPGWNPKPKRVERQGRDVVFVMDVSRSMLAEDLKPSRLERAKLAILDCLETLQGDRVALVAFAGSAAVKCPLTLDYGFFRMMLNGLSTDTIARGGTLIGDALRRTLDEVFDNQDKQYKDIILITDGEDHDSFPVEAAKEVGQRGVRLIAIGLGDENEGKRIPITDAQGQSTYLKYQGQEVWSRLDADTLRKMVNATPGGRYLNVATGTFDLGRVYLDLVASAEKKALESQTIKQYEDKFQIFLGLAFALLAVEMMVAERKSIRGRPIMNAERTTTGRPVHPSSEPTGPKESGTPPAGSRRPRPKPAARPSPTAGSRQPLVLLAGLLILAAPVVRAESAARLVARGNAALARGQYDEALKRYDEASVEAPASPQLAFNKGTAYYHLGDFAKAKESFAEAAVNTQDLALDARCRFNLGNVAFREAERQRDSDLQKALAACQESVRHYQKALELNPKSKVAAENLEVVRLTMKAILDEIHQQEEAQKQQQQQQQAAQDRLRELIARQQAALDQGQALASQPDQARQQPDWAKQVDSLRDDQNNLLADTSAFSLTLTNAPTQAPSPQPNPVEAARTHVEAATLSQGKAVDQLDQHKPDTAQADQQDALESLQKALAALNAQGQPQTGDQNQQQQPQPGQPQPQPQDSPDQKPQQQKPEDAASQAQDQTAQTQPTQRLDERAQDILKEEEQHQKERQRVQAGGFRPVDKDW